MRKLILPLIIFFVAFFTVADSKAQPGTGDGVTCGTAPNIPLDGQCRNYIQAANPIMTGNRQYCTSLANGGRYYWVKFRTTLANQCASLEINATDFTTGINVPVEVAFYRRTNPAVDPCPGVLQGTQDGSMCFADGRGIWAPLAPNFNLQANSDYYIRLYSPIATPANLRYSICGRQFVPENDFCADAMPIPAGTPSDGVLDNNVCETVSAQEVQSVTPNWICAISYQNMAWYTFTTLGNPGASTINISGVDCDTYNNAAQNYIQAGLLILKPGRNCFDPGSGNASPFQQAGGTDASPASVCGNPATGGSINLTTRSLPYGTRVYLAIDGYDGANCKYVLSGTNIIPIPIKLKHLIGSRDGDMNRISWVTSWEFNNDYFEVERSTDRVKFESIGRVPGKKNSDTDVFYSLNDNNPPAIAYYRLRQVDIDGGLTYSKVVMVKRENVSGLSVNFNNPVRNGEWITINALEAGKLNLQVVDGAGRTLSVQSLNCQRGNNTVMKDFSKLSAGNYYLVLTQDGNKLVKPFIKQ